MESHNREYKAIWKDEYLKWICGFGNAQGGQLFIGLDDNGNTTGLSNVKQLSEELPNKIVTILGLMVDVNIHHKNSVAYLEIVTAPSNVPISYNGSYYYRSGSTKQELKGSALHEFLLKKMGRSWDDIPAESASMNDIEEKAILRFRELAVGGKRLSTESVDDDVEIFLKNLHLISGEEKLKCATILLFGKNPLKFFRHAYFKIGRFGQSNHDLQFHDIVEGNIFDMTEKVMIILRSKYLKSLVKYEGLVRKEELEYPEPVLREAILNSIVHKDYSNTFIQLSVYDDKLVLWNPGTLPNELSVEALRQKHSSHPRNKNIADIFFKAGYIEAWGRGISKIIDTLQIAGFPDPIFEEAEGGFRVTLMKEKLTEENLKRIGLNDRQIKAIFFLKNNRKITNAQYVELNKISKTTASRELRDLQTKGLIKGSGKMGAGSDFALIGS